MAVERLKTCDNIVEWLRESLACESTTAKPAADMSRPMRVRGGESVLLADWTSLHLDIVARDRGLMRCAESLYQL